MMKAILVKNRPFYGTVALTVFLSLILLLSLTQLSTANAATIQVDTAADTLDANSGTCGGMTIADLPGPDGVTSLREAICAANGAGGSNDITFANNYTITLNGSALPDITGDITIKGKGESNTIIQASACNPVTKPGGCTPANHRVLKNDGHLTLQDLTIRHGNVSGDGGGVENRHVLDITRCTFSGNSADDDGGGIYNDDSIGTIAYSTFSGNYCAELGGGIVNYHGNIGTITHSTFSNNSTNDAGGGISNFDDATITTITHSTFSGNDAVDDGGGIHNCGDVEITTISNCTFSDNSADDDGGGIHNCDSDATINTIAHSTFSNNSAKGSGGGIDNRDRIVNMEYSIVANSSSGGNCSGDSPSTSADNLTDSSGCWSWADTSLTAVHLGPLANNGGATQTHALRFTSPANPAIDTGPADCSGAPINDTDQRDVTRSDYGNCDLGAFEYSGSDVTPGRKTVVFRSQRLFDGFVRETSETSGKGGYRNRGAKTFPLGDDAKNRQYRAILSFNTARIPDDARIIKVRLKIKKARLVGTDPFDTHGKLKVDVRKRKFGKSRALHLEDFQAGAGAKAVGVFKKLPKSRWYQADLNGVTKSHIYKRGTTQFRLRFGRDDNNDAGADYLKFFSGDARASRRPRLIVEYKTP